MADEQSVGRDLPGKSADQPPNDLATNLNDNAMHDASMGPDAEMRDEQPEVEGIDEIQDGSRPRKSEQKS